MLLQRTSAMLLSSEQLANSTPLWINVLQRVAISIQPEHHVDHVLSQVKGFWKPKATNQWTLMNQVIKAMQSFSSFHLVSGSKAAGSVTVNQLAQVAIANHLASAPTSNGEASTSGSSHNDLQEHLPGGDLTSAGPSKRRRYVTYP
jgi:BarA-like signal transduction histidine kinase